ncbi:hypothetical protein D3C76_1737360 [compost metagenome]
MNVRRQSRLHFRMALPNQSDHCQKRTILFVQSGLGQGERLLLDVEGVNAATRTTGFGEKQRVRSCASRRVECGVPGGESLARQLVGKAKYREEPHR